MEGFSVREVIEMAVQTERLGHDYYSALSDKFDERKEISELFRNLADQELRHEKSFLELKKKIREELTENWEEASEYLRAIVESEFFIGMDKPLKLLEHNGKSLEEIIDFVTDFEKDTLLFYMGLRDTLTEKNIINAVIKEEKNHIKRLHNLKKSLKR